MQLTVTYMSQGTFPDPPPYQSLQTWGGGGAQEAYINAVRLTSEMQTTAYVTSSDRSLLWLMLLQLLWTYPQPTRNFNKDGIKFSNFDEERWRMGDRRYSSTRSLNSTLVAGYWLV
jgi:hypothetical protein